MMRLFRSTKTSNKNMTAEIIAVKFKNSAVKRKEPWLNDVFFFSFFSIEPTEPDSTRLTLQIIIKEVVYGMKDFLVIHVETMCL